MRRPPPREQPPGRRFRRDLPRPEGPFDRLLRRRPERDPAPIIIGGTIAFLAIVIILVVGISTILGGGSDDNGGSNSGDGGELDFGGIRGRITSRLPALPPGLEQVSDYIEFDLEDDLPPVRGFALPLRQTTDDPAGLGFYTFDESRWRRLAEVKVVRGGRAESEFTEVPANLVVLRVAAQPYQVAGSLPPGGSLHPDSQVTIISPRDYTPAQDGSVQGTPTALPPEGEFLVIPTIVGSGTDTANVVNDILADEERRDSHLQAIVSLVSDSALDGIDLEYSSVDVDLEPEFTEFVTTLADRLGDKRLSLTLPPPSDQQRQAYDWKALGEAVDMIKILPIADPVSYWETMPRAISQISEDVDPKKILLVVSPYSIEGVADVTRPIGYLQAMVLAAEAAVREPANPDDIKPGVTVKLVARNLDQAEGGSPLRWDEDAAAVRFDLGGTERRRIVIENNFSVGFKLEIVQAYRLGGLAVSDASAQSDVANVWPVIKELMRSATVSLVRPNETALLPVWQAPDGGDFGAGSGTSATWIAPKEGPHNVVLVVSDGERRFGRKTVVEVKKAGPQASPTPAVTFGPTATVTPTPAPTPEATQTPKPTLPVEMGVRADGDDADTTAENDEVTTVGSNVTYYVIIDNDSNVKVNVTSLVDSIHGSIGDCQTLGGSPSAVGIELEPDDGDGPGDVDPDGVDSVSCTYVRQAPLTPGTIKPVVTVSVQAADGQTGTDFDDNTKVTTTP